MTVEQVVANLGLGGIVADQAVITQVGLLAGAGILFVAALALCIIAMRAASSAKQSRLEVQELSASMTEMAGEMRHLTAQVERAAYAQQQAEEQAEKEAEAHLENEDAADGQSFDAEDQIEPEEEDEKRSGPSALLRGFLSRR